MPSLKHVLPPEFMQGCFESGKAWALRDTPVTAVKLTTGAPCSSHDELFADWPGKDQHVSKWFILANGSAVGINEDPRDGLSFPVISYNGDTE